MTKVSVGRNNTFLVTVEKSSRSIIMVCLSLIGAYVFLVHNHVVERKEA